MGGKMSFGLSNCLISSLILQSLHSWLVSLSTAYTFVTLPNPFLSFNKITIPSPSNKRLLASPAHALRISATSKKWEPTKVVPQADRVLVRLEQLPEKSAGGVLLPKAAVKFERYLMGEILSVGVDVGEVGAGKKVLFSDISAYEVDLETDDRHCFVKESDLLAVVE